VGCKACKANRDGKPTATTLPQTCLTPKPLSGMTLRPVTGFVESQLRLIGPDWCGADFSTLGHRHKTLAVLGFRWGRCTR